MANKKKIKLALYLILIVFTFVDIFGMLLLVTSKNKKFQWGNFQKKLSSSDSIDIPHLQNDYAVKFLEKEFDKAYQEIQMRLSHEHSLYFYQFVLIGAIFLAALGSTGLFSSYPAGNKHFQQNNVESVIVTRLMQSGA